MRSSGSAPVTSTGSGRVAGVRAEDHLRFLGIPFAEPPFGAHRLAAPVRVAEWDGVRDAVTPAPTAPQPAQGFTIIPEPTIDGGDAPACLSLNVFTPELGDARLPVLVWFHGGGFVTGTPSSPWYDGRSFCRSGIVVVSVGYRLGAEGFLDVVGAPTNRGVLDWLAALEWVQENVAAFGGDPGRVTIAGQSAGGVAVTTLLGLPGADGLFRRGIAMSGSAMPTSTAERRAAIAATMADSLGVTCDRDGFSSVGPAAVVAAQEVVDASTLPDDPGNALAGRMLHSPFVDGDVVPVAPIDAIDSGMTDGVDLLLGATEQEFNLVTAALELDDDALVAMLGALGLAAPDARALIAESVTSHGLTYGQALTDSSFRVPSTLVADARAGRGARTFHYDFRFGAALGAVHCIDIPFAWGLLDAEAVEIVAGDPAPAELGDAVHEAYVDFVVHGDPGWSPWTTERRTSMVFDADGGTEVVDALAPQRARWTDAVRSRQR